MGEGDDPRDQLLFDLLFDTGLRLGELTALNVGDISGKDYLTVVGKGRKERTIPIGAGDGLKDKINLDYSSSVQFGINCRDRFVGPKVFGPPRNDKNLCERIAFSRDQCVAGSNLNLGNCRCCYS